MMNTEQQEKCKRILDHYGAANQRRQLIEECADLIQAVNKYERAMNSITTGYYPDVVRAKNDIAQEMADVLIMIEQVSTALFKNDKSFIDEMIEYKLNRQLQRMKEGK